jgi:hypothetical protein
MSETSWPSPQPNGSLAGDFLRAEQTLRPADAPTRARMFYLLTGRQAPSSGPALPSGEALREDRAPDTAPAGFGDSPQVAWMDDAGGAATGEPLFLDDERDESEAIADETVDDQAANDEERDDEPKPPDLLPDDRPPTDPAPPDAPPPTPPAPERHGPPLRTELEVEQAPMTATAPAWVQAMVEQGTTLQRPKADAARLPDPPSLFVPARTRSILVAALSVSRPEGRIDVPALVQHVARGAVPTRVPRRPVPSLAYGVQLLVDRSPAMRPYRRDARALEADVRRVVGAARLDVLRFAGSPWRGAGRGSKRRWTSYADDHVPPPGTSVLCVTDLGLGVPPSGPLPPPPADWLRLGRLLARRACPLVLLVPYGPARWPAPLAHALALVHWDPRTTAATVKSAR